MARQKRPIKRNYNWNVSAIYKRGNTKKSVTKLVSLFVSEEDSQTELFSMIDKIFLKCDKGYFLDEISVRLYGCEEIIATKSYSKTTNANLTKCPKSNKNGKNRRRQYKVVKRSVNKGDTNLLDKKKEAIKIRNQNLFKYMDEVKMINIQSSKPTDSFIIYPFDKQTKNPIDIPNDTEKTKIWTIIAQYADVNTSEIYTIRTVCGIDNEEYVHELSREKFPTNLGNYSLCQIQIRKYKPSDNISTWISSQLTEIFSSPKLLNRKNIKVGKGVSKELELKYEMDDFLKSVKKHLNYGFE